MDMHGQSWSRYREGRAVAIACNCGKTAANRRESPDEIADRLAQQQEINIDPTPAAPSA
jgi:hypothetical protein